MKTKNVLMILFAFAIAGLSAKAMNVSGGIYANTTWTQINSPYIVTDTIVVFPGVTLTIEPGVVVKFDSLKFMELRQAAIIAIGTITDSIIFTSNSSNPMPGIWGRIWINGGTMTSQFNYVSVSYSTNGIGFDYLSNDTVFLKNSIFYLNNYGFGNSSGVSYVDSCIFKNNNNVGFSGYHGYIQNSTILNNGIGAESYGIIRNCVIDSNQVGINPLYQISNCVIKNNGLGLSMPHQYSVVDSCVISLNDTGIFCLGGSVRNSIIDSNLYFGFTNFLSQDTIINCQIKSNGIGIKDTSGMSMITLNDIEDNGTGIVFGTEMINCFCNKICGSSTYDVKYTVLHGSNASLQNNYWCTNDSSMIASHIYDDMIMWF